MADVTATAFLRRQRSVEAERAWKRAFGVLGISPAGATAAEEQTEMMVQGRWLRITGVVLGYAFLVYAGQVASEWVLEYLEADLRPSRQAVINSMILGAAALYVLLLALPFMPGIEIGLGLMIMLGPDISLLVYLSTVLALMLSFGIGRIVPMGPMIAAFDWLGLARARDMVAAIAPLTPAGRLEFLMSRVPARFLSIVLRRRYLALALILNLPGNALIGGGGGIALVAGMSRVFNFPAFFVTVAVAVSPVPIIYYLVGGFR